MEKLQQGPSGQEQLRNQERGLFETFFKKYGMRIAPAIVALMAAGCAPGEIESNMGQLRNSLGQAIAEANANARAQAGLRDTEIQSYQHNASAALVGDGSGVHVEFGEQVYLQHYPNGRSNRFKN